MKKEKKEKLIRFWSEVFDLLTFMIFVFWIVLSFRFFIFTPYTVLWSSMMPNFKDKDRIIVEKISQKASNLKRWDVIVFVPPWKTIPYIKRIIWFPWETVLVQDWNVYICSTDTPASSITTSSNLNCQQLPEKYLPDYTPTVASCWMNEFPITEWYFVMWDNRWRTTDSLCCFWIQCYIWANYTVPDSHLIWKAILRLYPTFTKF